MAFLHEHIILPLSDRLKGESVHKYFRLLSEAESWSDEQMKDFQKQRLQQLLTYASTEVPFYRDWFHDHQQNPNTISINQMPIVDKTIMRQDGIARFSAVHFPEKERIITRSSGSTGEPFVFYTTRLSDSVNTAAKLRTWYQAGYRLGDYYIKIANGARQGKWKKLQDKINHCLYVPFYSLNDDALKSILELVERHRPRFIRAYPIPLYLLARYRNNHTGFCHRLQHVFTTGSTLPDTYRKEMEEAFGCDVIDSYSCEGTPNTYETPSHDGYHVTGYYGIIEVLDGDNQPVINGIGRVVSTDLWNLAQPFIRYDTQDLVEVKDGKIVRIMGRESDALIPANGTLFTVHNFSHFFTHDIKGVDSYQIVRHRDNSITFNIVVNEEFDCTKNQVIINYWQQQLGVAISVNPVDEIPLMNNNKRRTIICES